MNPIIYLDVNGDAVPISRYYHPFTFFGQLVKTPNIFTHSWIHISEGFASALEREELKSDRQRFIEGLLAKAVHPETADAILLAIW